MTHQELLEARARTEKARGPLVIETKAFLMVECVEEVLPPLPPCQEGQIFVKIQMDPLPAILNA